ncbi:MAG TPA: ADP-ribosylglycohydrolase family protein [Actinoplanes sp.]|jgi:ADP-ribosylglycohydrolase|nr:ADP-ribosylglycohydrolase family protein [Actinoplanes sp.]
MSRPIADYAEQIYAGVLGKIIGVYLGRPVEGWSYPALRERFGELNYYVNGQLGEPLVVADDDVSGTFAFARAIADHGYPAGLLASQVGDTWLNYIIENRTILWWGGLGRSTEHTAYLRLKAGIPAPESGSFAANGPTLPEQVGAQIFSDAIAMSYPGDPQRAAAAVRAAASVSHDGVAVDAAAFLAAMRALAFDRTDLIELVDRCRHEIHDRRLNAAVDRVVALCAKTSDWREVRDVIDDELGYARFDGPCHVIPNHAMTLAALLLGGDDFQRAVMIAASAGFDTDSNAGVVGCLNGIRLGLDALTAQVDFRAEVADRLLVVTSDGGSCVSDAVLETRKIASAARALRGEPAPPAAPRFGFEQRGSVQGFVPCPLTPSPYPTVRVVNGKGLQLICTGVGPGVPAAVSTPVFLDAAETADNFSTVASPTLYPGQRVTVTAGGRDADLRLYVVHRDPDGTVRHLISPALRLSTADQALSWTVPDTGNAPLLRLGLLVEATARFDGTVTISSVDWAGAPEHFRVGGVLLTSIWDTHPEPLRAWVSSAANFEADSARTFSVSHPHGVALATTGTRDWNEYTVAGTLRFSLHRRAGLVARSVGHRRYYAAEFRDGTTLSLTKQHDARTTTLKTIAFPYRQDHPYRVGLTVAGDRLTVAVDGRTVIDTIDDSDPFRAGAAGFLIGEGTVFADDFEVTAAHPDGGDPDAERGSAVVGGAGMPR